jgi:hypothetical protein
MVHFAKVPIEYIYSNLYSGYASVCGIIISRTAVLVIQSIDRDNIDGTRNLAKRKWLPNVSNALFRSEMHDCTIRKAEF